MSNEFEAIRQLFGAFNCSLRESLPVIYISSHIIHCKDRDECRRWSLKIQQIRKRKLKGSLATLENSLIMARKLKDNYSLKTMYLTITK